MWSRTEAIIEPHIRQNQRKCNAQNCHAGSQRARAVIEETVLSEIWSQPVSGLEHPLSEMLSWLIDKTAGEDSKKHDLLRV